MVDPNRKINRLTAEDIAFLDQCEEMFGNRFSESDEDYSAHCEKGVPEPPVVTGFSSGGSQGQHNSYRGRYNDNRYRYRGGRGSGQRGYQGKELHNRRGDGRYAPYRNPRNNYNERNDERAANNRREREKFPESSSSQRGGEELHT